MKKRYEKPVIGIEHFELNASIASGCKEVLSLGPGLPGKYERCSEFPDIQPFSYHPGDHRKPERANFYPGTCNCYLTAGTGEVFTS